MGAYDTYEFRERSSFTAALAMGRSSRSVWGSWLALLFALLSVGLCVWAWTNNDNVVAWGLSHGLVKEAATRTLPGVVKVASIAGGVLALTAAGLALRPVRLAVGSALSYMALGISTVVRPLGLGISAGARLLALALSRAWLGATVVAHFAALVLRYVRFRVSAILRYVRLAVAAVARAVGLLHAYAWRVVAAVVRAGAPVLRYIWVGVATVARAIGLALSYVVGGTLIALYLPWLGFQRYVWPSVATVLGYLQRGIVAVARAIGMALGHVRAGVFAVLSLVRLGVAAVARAAAMALRYPLVAVSAALGHLARGAAILAQAASLALRYMWIAVSAALAHFGRGMAIVGRAVAMTLRYAWRMVAAVARAVAVVLGYMGRGVAVLVQAAGLVLRYVWIAVSAALGHLGRGVAVLARAAGQALRYLWVAVFAALGHFGRGMAIVGRAVAKALRFGWRAIAAVARPVAVVLGYTWRAVAALAQVVAVVLVYGWLGLDALARAVGLALRHLGMAVSVAVGHLSHGVAIVARGVAMVLRHLAHGVAIIARVAGLALGYLWMAVSIVLVHLWRGVIVVTWAIGLTLRHLWVAVSAALGHLGRGIATVAQAVGVVVRYAWMGISMVLGHLERGIATIAQAVGTVVRYVWMGVFALLAYLGAALFSIIHPMRLATSAVLRYLWLGVRTAALVLGWALHHVWKGTLIILQGLRRAPVVVVRTLWTAFTASPDLLSAVVWMIKHRKGVPAMSDHNLTRERLLSLVVTVLAFFTIASIGVRIAWPAPPEPTVEVVHWATGHLFRDGLLPEMAAEFNEAGHRVKSGTRIAVEVVNDPSSLQAEDLLSRITGGGRLDAECCPASATPHPDPTIVTPSSAHWLVPVNQAAQELGLPNVVDPDSARSIARAYIGILTYREMAACLGWPEKELGYADIIELRADPQGWKKHDCAKPSWGTRPLLAFTDPKTSSTGRSVLLALYAIAAGKLPEELTVADVDDPNVVGYVKEFQRLIDHYFIGTTVMNTKIYQGPRFGQFFLMPEDNLIHLYEGTERAFFGGKKRTAPPISEPMVMLYPKEGSMARNNCACIAEAPWVTPEHVEAAEKWIDFIREDEQQRAFMRAGFRPVTDLPLSDPSSKINGEYGLAPRTPAAVMNVALIDPPVAAAIDRSWKDVKRAGIVTFVVDTSGSMLGNKLKQAKDGLIRALDSMAVNNQVGFLSFDDTINENTRIPVGPLADTGTAIVEAVDKMRARGETALYHAIKAGVEMTAAAEGDEDAIRAVVVLTDGRANRCQTRLDDLIEMESTSERPILQFGGCEGDPKAMDEHRLTVEREDIIGTKLAIETDPPVQIFFIGIGDDADLEAGRILAEATGAEFQGVTEEDLANLLEEFSGYF